MLVYALLRLNDLVVSPTKLTSVSAGLFSTCIQFKLGFMCVLDMDNKANSMVLLDVSCLANG